MKQILCQLSYKHIKWKPLFETEFDEIHKEIAKFKYSIPDWCFNDYSKNKRFHSKQW